MQFNSRMLLQKSVGNNTRLLADHVKTIYVVEPNGEMRKACEKSCKEFKSFVSIDASAEDTSLPDSSADFITVAQAFHWFDKEKAGLEFRRILRPDSKVVLVWNSRVSDNEFIIENDELCRQLCKDYTGFSGGSGHEADVNRDFFRDGHCDYGFSKTTDCSHLKNTSVAVYRHPMHL